ncbi:permease prefix domain 1-containing protein [Streptomyces sp. NPDC059687]|uniref:permease prefix domain 1-containing protein n=1 Tax=Streptomyces sp. NPDC059687 TaxID=3346905 RepID=UPI0036852CE3
MSPHHLIDAYLGSLHHRLPADVVSELADGLVETYEHYRNQGLTPDTAARAAIADFGSPDLIVAGFAHTAPGRRIARTLLFTGPLVGACWAAALLTTQPWPPLILSVARVAAPTALFAIVGLLVVALRGPYRRIRAAAFAASAGLVIVDTAALITLTVLALPFTGFVLGAATASALRITLTMRVIPRLTTAG